MNDIPYVDLKIVKAYAEDQRAVADRAGELAARRLWQALGETAQQLIAMNQRIDSQAEAKRARRESWKG